MTTIIDKIRWVLFGIINTAIDIGGFVAVYYIWIEYNFAWAVAFLFFGMPVVVSISMAIGMLFLSSKQRDELF